MARRRIRKLKVTGEPYNLMWTKDRWMNDPELSIARFYGERKVGGFDYRVSKKGDLVWSGIWDAYQVLGTFKVMAIIKEHGRAEDIKAAAAAVEAERAAAEKAAKIEAMQGTIDWEGA